MKENSEKDDKKLKKIEIVTLVGVIIISILISLLTFYKAEIYIPKKDEDRNINIIEEEKDIINKTISKQERELQYLERELKGAKNNLRLVKENHTNQQSSRNEVLEYEKKVNILENAIFALKRELKVNENKKNELPKNAKERTEQRKILDQIRREKIINKTLESLKGNLAFYVPNTMKWDETYKVYVGVSKDSVDEISRQIIKEGQSPYREKKIEIIEIETDTIPLWIEMYAEILDPTNNNSFRISPTGKLYEKIDVGGLNVDIWEWDVTPISFDTSYLQLNIFRTTDKDNYELVFNSTEKVIIQSTIWDRILEFLKNNWQYIIGSICVPFIIWIVKRFTDKNKKET